MLDVSLNNIKLASQALGLDEDFISDLITHYPEYHQSCPNNVRTIRKFDIESFQDVLAGLPAQIKEKLAQDFFAELATHDSSTNQFNCYLSLFSDYQTRIEKCELDIQVLQSTHQYVQDHLTTLASLLEMPDEVDVDIAFAREFSINPEADKKTFLENLSKEMEDIKRPYQLRNLLKIPLSRLDYQAWAEDTIENVVSDKNTQWHMKNSLNTLGDLKQLISAQSRAFAELKEKAEQLAEDEALELTKLEHQRSKILRFVQKVEPDKLLNRITELKENSDWQDNDLTHQKIEKVKSQLRSIKGKV